LPKPGDTGPLTSNITPQPCREQLAPGSRGLPGLVERELDCYYLCRRAAPDPGSGKTTGQEANEPRPSVPLERQVSAGIADGRVVLSRRSARAALRAVQRDQRDRKSTRLNSSHLGISYAVFC